MTAKSRLRKRHKKIAVQPMPHMAIEAVAQEHGLDRYIQTTCQCDKGQNHFKTNN